MVTRVLTQIAISFTLLFIGFSIGDPETGSALFSTAVNGIYENTIGLL